jgi:hypothetical protein
MTTLSPIFNAHTRPELPTGAESWEYLVVSLQEDDGLKAGDPCSPESLNELGALGWEAVGLLPLKQGDLAWPVVLLKRPLT